MISNIKNYTLDDVKRSIREFEELASQSEDVRALAVQITSGKINSVAAIYDWVKANVKYTPDPDEIELFIAPTKLVSDWNNHVPLAGDCDDIAMLVVALLRAVGVKTDVVLLDTTGGGPNHALAVVHSEVLGKDIMVDASTDEVPLGWDIPYLTRVDIK